MDHVVKMVYLYLRNNRRTLTLLKSPSVCIEKALRLDRESFCEDILSEIRTIMRILNENDK